MGYTGRELARQAVARGWRVCGTTTAAAAAAAASSDVGASAVAAAAARGSRGGPGPAGGSLRVVRFAPRRDGSDRARGAGPDSLLCPAGRAALRAATHVLSSIPPVATPMYDPVLAAQLELLRWRLGLAGGSLGDGGGEGDGEGGGGGGGGIEVALAPPLAWIGYLSSTGVYGDRGGGWVDEDSEPTPSSARGVVRLEHERAWERALGRALLLAQKGAGPGAAAAAAAPAGRAPGFPDPALRIFRLGGIYGPGRSVLEPLLFERGGGRGGKGGGEGGGGEQQEGSADAAGAAAAAPQRERRRRQRFTSRVHVADAARAVLASAEQWRPRSGGERDGGGGGGDGGGSDGGYLAGGGDGFPPLPARVYNVVDDLPAPRSEVEAYALGRLRAIGLVAAAAEGGRGDGRGGGEDDKGGAQRATARRGGTDDDGAAPSPPSEPAAAAAAPDAAAVLPPLEEKRVRNARLKRELLTEAHGAQLLYPDYRPAIDELVEQRRRAAL